jgi:hypothetical protein
LLNLCIRLSLLGTGDSHQDSSFGVRRLLCFGRILLYMSILAMHIGDRILRGWEWYISIIFRMFSDRNLQTKLPSIRAEYQSLVDQELLDAPSVQKALQQTEAAL